MRKVFHRKLFKTPKEALAGLAMAGQRKAALRLDGVVLLGILAGCWIALGSIASLVAAGGLPNADPGLVKLVAGITFSPGLMIVVGAGAELFTGNILYMTVGLLEGRVTLFAVARSWVLAWVSNFAGSLLVAYLLGFLTDIFGAEPWTSYVQQVAVSKLSYGWGAAFLRGVGANILVCLALLISLAAEDIGGKFIAVFFLISTFVLIGFEHCVANMSIVPIGLLYGADKSIGAMMGRNIIPSTLGNMCGGALVALAYWCVYLMPSRYANLHNRDISLNMWQRLVQGELNLKDDGLEREWEVQKRMITTK